jgi:hypothetical protein
MADKVSGRIIVSVVYLGAIFMATALFLVGYKHKVNLRKGREAVEVWDKTVSPDAIRARMSALPQEWMKVTFVDTRGYVLFIPCYSENSALTLVTAPDSLPGINCEECDSLSDRRVTEIWRNSADSALHFTLSPARGELSVLPVRRELLAKFPGAPFQDKILLWITPKAGKAGTPPTAGIPTEDTLIFAPKSQEKEFQVLRAADENSEGCGGSEPEAN